MKLDYLDAFPPSVLTVI